MPWKVPGVRLHPRIEFLALHCWLGFTKSANQPTTCTSIRGRPQGPTGASVSTRLGIRKEIHAPAEHLAGPDKLQLAAAAPTAQLNKSVF